jgi:hypothetical protein
VEDLLEAEAVLGELVDGGCGGRRELAALDEAGVLELAQARRENLRADAGQALGDVGVAARPLQELAHDEQRPALANDRQRVRDRAVLVEPTGHETEA